MALCDVTMILCGECGVSDVQLEPQLTCSLQLNLRHNLLYRQSPRTSNTVNTVTPPDCTAPPPPPPTPPPPLATPPTPPPPLSTGSYL